MTLSKAILPLLPALTIGLSSCDKKDTSLCEAALTSSTTASDLRFILDNIETSTEESDDGSVETIVVTAEMDGNTDTNVDCLVVPADGGGNAWSPKDISTNWPDNGSPELIVTVQKHSSEGDTQLWCYDKSYTGEEECSVHIPWSNTENNDDTGDSGQTLYLAL